MGPRRIGGQHVRTPVELTGLLGEGWCVTVTRGGVLEALSGMEVDPIDVRWGVANAEIGVPGSVGLDDVPVTLFARDLGDDVTLVVQVDARTGWVGTRPDVLETLSANGGMACSLTTSPHREELLYAADGAVLTGFDPATARRFGSRPALFDDRLTAAGFPGPAGDDEPGDVYRFSPVQRGVVAMEVMTGVRLDATMFDGPWAAGPTA